MSPGNEIRIWHSLALKCKRGVLVLPWQFIIKASEFLLNIHEVQWIITGLAIITNFSKCTDKRVKYIIFPYVTRTDDLNGFLKLGNFILSLNMFYTLSHFAQCNPFYPLFPFLAERKWKREGTERQGKKMSPASIRVLFYSSNSSLPAACLYFPFLPDCTKMRPISPLIHPDISLVAVFFLCKSNTDHNNKKCASDWWKNN